MKRVPISFQTLLEKVLPLEDLPLAERLRVERALRSGTTGQLEQVALMAIEQLEARGALRRLPTGGNGDYSAVRFQPRDALEIITLQLPQPIQSEGVVAFSRARLPARAPAGVDQVRRLLRLDDPLLHSDPRVDRAQGALLSQLDQAARELLGASARFFVAGGPEDPREPWLDSELAHQAIAHPNHVFYVPDAWATKRLESAARRLSLRSAVLVGVLASDGTALGHLEVRSAEPDPFSQDDLARAVLLAECCGGMLERAARIEKLVFIDTLTGAYNRSYFDLQARNEMARAERENASLALCIADIDDFKSFNTTYGYEAGNQVLQQVAQALRRGVRPFDTVARWGGEEFAVLLTPPVAADDVQAICERLRVAVERTNLRLEGLDRRSHQVGVTVSCGVALYPDHAREAADLWRFANQALLRAKRPPKNQVVFHDASSASSQ